MNWFQDGKSRIYKPDICWISLCFKRPSRNRGITRLNDQPQKVIRLNQWICLDVGSFARKWIGLKIPNLRWKGNDLHFEFRCLDVHGNSCWNQRIAPNSKYCLDVQNMELNFNLGLGFFSLYIPKFLFFIQILLNFDICTVFEFLEFFGSFLFYIFGSFYFIISKFYFIFFWFFILHFY
jgi:hypothetical protein